MDFLVIIGPIALVLLGFVVGRVLEARHYASIREREAKYLQVPVVSFENGYPDRPIRAVRLATGAVVVSIDHYKRFLAGFRLFFGGELGSYASLIDRGRREAVLRMRESCPKADMFVNCRIETSAIFQGKQGKKDSTGTVEVFAYATALEFVTE